ncbi:homoaconitase [Xylaria sp. CBS 124048]|nr:homoaconitase [Xylaria sp. CBS 124048]
MTRCLNARAIIRRPVLSLWTRSVRVPSRSIHYRPQSASIPFRARPLNTTTFVRTNATASSTLFPAEKQTAQTLTEKIVQNAAVGLPEGKLVRSGDYISLSPQYCMSHDNTWPIALKFMSLGATKINRPEQLVFTLDHDIQNKSETNLAKYRKIQEFAELHGVTHYPAGRGIGHQIMVEEGYAWPGTTVVASDSHTPMLGALGCLGTPIVRTDAASVWATSQTWWQVPPIARVTFTGTLPAGVTGKDVILALCGKFGDDCILNHAIEFTGTSETMASLSVDSRLTIANMVTEWGGLSGLFPIDETLERWLRYKATESAMFKDATVQKRINHERIDALFANPPTADPNAMYAKQLYLNLSTLSPFVAGPNSVKAVTALSELAPKNIKLDKAYLVSCTNSRFSDLAAAAKVFKDAAAANPGTPPKIADGVSFYIAAASSIEQEAAESTGDWQVLLDAGAQPLPSGCGPCIGLGVGLLKAGEVGISASNRNFAGRMGDRTAHAYLASPEVVAASALSGTISGPGNYQAPADYQGAEYGFGTGSDHTTEHKLTNFLQQMESFIERVESVADSASPSDVKILSGFPEKISGEILFCDVDNLNTDGIYPGKYTYEDNVSKETMARVCMENYDPAFSGIVKPNDILVSGFNFGCGSSREQAATSLLASQIPLVVAGSFSNVFSRNSINNALMGLEVPRLVERLRVAFAADKTKKQLTKRTGWTLTWDLVHSTIEVQEGEGGETWTEKVPEMPLNIQEIIVAGGLEAWVKGKIKN